jgi:3-oxoacyl-[acyl-carrier protein] reductase
MLLNKVMLITGTSSGIGLGLAKHYSELGLKVVGGSRRDSDFSHSNYRHMIVDVTDEEEVRKWISIVRKQYGRIDILVCNAGSIQSSLLSTVTPFSIVKEFIDIHFLGTFLVCKEVSKVMIQQRFGRIINVSTIGIPLHLEGTAAYSASKAAVVEFTMVLAKELAPLGITCNVLAPSLFLSDSAMKLGSPWAEKLLNLQTIKRLAEVKDISNVVSFFASDDSDLVTGQVLSLGLVTS